MTRSERRRGCGAVEREGFGKLSAIGVEYGFGEVGRLTGLSDVNCGAKVKSKKV